MQSQLTENRNKPDVYLPDMGGETALIDRDWESVGYERLSDDRFEAVYYKKTSGGIAGQVGIYVALKRSENRLNSYIPDFEDSVRSERLDRLAEWYAKL